MMVQFLVRRVLQAIVVLWAVATAVFFLINFVGNPAALMLPEDASPQQVAQLSHQLGFDVPIIARYGAFLLGILHGDLGQSVWTNTSVTGLVVQYFPPTFFLAIITVVIALAIGVGLGVVAAVSPDSVPDRIVTVIAYVGVAFPEFWLGLLLIALFAVTLGLLPTSGYGGPQYFVLPVITLLARPIGRFAETTRVSLRSELSKDYVYTALSLGLRRGTVIVRQALRNSLLSVLTLAGDEVAILVAGSIGVEVIFAWPGTGFLSYQAIQRRDPALVIGIVLAVCVVVLLINIITDLVYRILDPRINLSGAAR